MFEFTHPAGSVSQSARPLAASIAAHSLAGLLLFALRFSSPVASFPIAQEHVIMLAPTKEPAVLPRKVRAPLRPQFRPPTPAALQLQPLRLQLPAATILPAPEIEVAKAILPEISKAPVTPSVIKTNGFSEAKPAAPQTAPKAVVKASGFQSAETAATGPVSGRRSAVGSFESTHLEGAPVRNAGSVARSSGFSDAPASSPGGVRGGSVTRGTFGDTTVDKGAAAVRQTAAVAFTPVEIVFKPKPAYTDEARAKKIEGEVLLAMQFSASGEARVDRVMRGLGYGLDESAVAAARGIRFRPAMRDGGAVDSAAVVHIVFQLAQ